jgi:hypothetical protein
MFVAGVVPKISWHSVVSRARSKLWICGIIDKRFSSRIAHLSVFAELIYTKLFGTVNVGTWCGNYINNSNTSRIFKSLIFGLKSSSSHCYSSKLRNSRFSIPTRVEIILKGTWNFLQLLIIYEILMRNQLHVFSFAVFGLIE